MMITTEQSPERNLKHPHVLATHVSKTFHLAQSSLWFMEHRISFGKVQIIKMATVYNVKNSLRIDRKQHIPRFLFLFHVLLYYCDNVQELHVARREGGKVTTKKHMLKCMSYFSSQVLISKSQVCNQNAGRNPCTNFLINSLSSRSKHFYPPLILFSIVTELGKIQKIEVNGHDQEAQLGTIN